LIGLRNRRKSDRHRPRRHRRRWRQYRRAARMDDAGNDRHGPSRTDL